MRLRRASRSARVDAAGCGGCRQGQDEALAAGEEGVEGAEVPGMDLPLKRQICQLP